MATCFLQASFFAGIWHLFLNMQVQRQLEWGRELLSGQSIQTRNCDMRLAVGASSNPFWSYSVPSLNVFLECNQRTWTFQGGPVSPALCYLTAYSMPKRLKVIATCLEKGVTACFSLCNRITKGKTIILFFNLSKCLLENRSWARALQNLAHPLDFRSVLSWLESRFRLLAHALDLLYSWIPGPLGMSVAAQLLSWGSSWTWGGSSYSEGGF